MNRKSDRESTMGFWIEVLRAAARTLEAAATSDVKVQIRRSGENVWRDFSYVGSNDESVQNGLALASSAHPDADVRALTKSGTIVDFY